MVSTVKKPLSSFIEHAMTIATALIPIGLLLMVTVCIFNVTTISSTHINGDKFLNVTDTMVIQSSDDHVRFVYNHLNKSIVFHVDINDMNATDPLIMDNTNLKKYTVRLHHHVFENNVFHLYVNIHNNVISDNHNITANLYNLMYYKSENRYVFGVKCPGIMSIVMVTYFMMISYIISLCICNSFPRIDRKLIYPNSMTIFSIIAILFLVLDYNYLGLTLISNKV